MDAQLFRLAGTVVFANVLTLAALARAEGTVELELVGDARGSAMAFQDWAQALARAGIRNVRLRTAADGSIQPGIETRGTAERPIYVVTGVVRGRDAIELPGRRFRRGDVGRLTQWLDDLAKNGPPESREKRAAFGLTASQLAAVRSELAAPVGFDTAGMTPGEVVAKIASQLTLPLELNADAIQSLGDEKLVDDLSGFSRGLALAYALRQSGRGLQPRPSGDRASYGVVDAADASDVWPVGWPPEGSPHETLPALFEFLNINVQNVSAAKALDAIAQRIKAPVLLDRSILARHGVDPAQAMVSLPRTRTTHSQALRKILFQARMKYELRCDDAGRPFLWVTSIKPEAAKP